MATIVSRNLYVSLGSWMPTYEVGHYHHHRHHQPSSTSLPITIALMRSECVNTNSEASIQSYIPVELMNMPSCSIQMGNTSLN